MFPKLFNKKTSQDDDIATDGDNGLQWPVNSDARFVLPALESGVLAGKCLVASPFMADSRFRNAVVYICSHSPKGAMGIVINHSLDEPGFEQLLAQFDIEATDATPDITVVQGGPLENSRGLLLHSKDYEDASTQSVSENLSLSCSLDILKSLAENAGPKDALLALGFAAWADGQLENELAEDSWLVAEASFDLLFEISCNHRWHAALTSMGIQPAFISQATGRA